MRRSRWRRLAFGLCVSLSGIAISSSLAWLLLVQERELVEVQFKLDAGKRIEAIQRTVTNRLGTLSAVTAFFNSSQLVERQEFRTFTAPLFENHPGIVALGWASRIPDARRDAHQETVRRQGFPKYEINQRDDAGRATYADKQDVYYPILFLESLREYRSFIGFDLGSNPVCRKAIEQSLATHRQVATICPPLDDNEDDLALLFVVQPTLKTHAALAERPADQPEIDGLVLAVFRLCTMVERSLSFFAPVGIDVDVRSPAELYGKTPVCTRLSPLHDGREGMEAVEDFLLPRSDAMHIKGVFDVANHSFTVDCVPLDAYLDAYSTWYPLATLLAGLVITGLLVGYLLLLTGRTARIELLVVKRTRELSESEQRFRHLVDNAGDAFFLHDQRGRVLDVNKRACESLGYTRDELLSMTVVEVDLHFVPMDTERYWKRSVEEYPISFEGNHRRKDGTTFPVEIRLTPLEIGGPRLMIALVRDITEQKQLIEKLQEGERKLRAILDQTFQFIGLLTPEGILTAANKTALAFSGISEESVLNKPFWDTPWWTHSPALQEELRQAVQRAAQGDFVRMEATHLAANGDLHWIDFSLKPVKDDSGKVAFLIPEGRDITDRKRAEKVIHQEQRLLREMLDLHERERMLVAYEIHDGLAQQLIGALYKLQSAEELLNSDIDAAKKTCDEGIELLGEAIAETRRLIGGLRPPLLDESGVVAAVEYLISERQRHEGPTIDFIHETEFCRLAPPIESALFRIVQECLTNACRYSQSEKVRVELRQLDDRVRVDVQDWGVGFDPAKVQGDHFGLRGIRERARLLGGSVVIETAPRQGVHITVELPLILPAENGDVKLASHPT